MKTKQLFIIFPFVLLMVSCEKYLDIKKTNTQSPITTAQDCQLLLDNYEINLGYPADGNLSADDYYVRDAEYGLDNVSQEEKLLYIWDASIVRSEPSQWQDTYKKIYTANLVIEAVEKIGKEGSSNSETLNGLKGSALFIRAFAHWQLAQLYAQPYSPATADQHPGIPLRLTSDINDQSERGTVQQTYSTIIQDLQEAVGLLQSSSIIASRPNKATVFSMLARVYQSMEDYPRALQNATAALQLRSELIDYNTITDTLTDISFNTRFNNEVIFHCTAASRSILSPNDNGSFIARIDSDLVASYNANDLRKYIFLNQNTVFDEVTQENIPDGSYRFTGNYEPSSSSDLFNGLAVDELYLIRAESYARAGNTVSAMDDLNTLLVTRWKTGTYTNMTAGTADEALSIILTERRKELLMRGMRWTDLRRLNHDSRFAKTLKREIGGMEYELPPNDLRYVLLIPNQIIQYGNIQQNPR